MDDFDRTLFDFANIQAELNYKNATTAVRELVANLDLTPRERQELEAEIDSLETLLDKLENAVVQIAAFGMVGRGKSSLLNALVGQTVFETGPLHGVTTTAQTANWNVDRDDEVLQVSFPGAGNSKIELIDTPGLDEVNGETRAKLAIEIAKQADLILFVVSGDITQIEFEALSQVREAGKPLLLVFNKVDRYPEADRAAIYEKIRDDRVRELLSPEEIVMVAASPQVARATVKPDGTRQVKWERGTPQVEPLKLKILEILHREGKSLVALNSLLYADEANDRVVQKKMAIRDRAADALIWKATIAKAVAIAVNPVTVLDAIGAAAVDVSTILGLSHLYGIPMTQTGAIDLLQKIVLGMGGVGASELLATLGLGSLKGLFGLATPISGGTSLVGYVSVAIAQASVAGVASYNIGQATKTYLANGASWGEESPKAAIARILASIDEVSILNRIKAELQQKLAMQ